MALYGDATTPRVFGGTKTDHSLLLVNIPGEKFAMRDVYYMTPALTVLFTSSKLEAVVVVTAR